MNSPCSSYAAEVTTTHTPEDKLHLITFNTAKEEEDGMDLNILCCLSMRFDCELESAVMVATKGNIMKKPLGFAADCADIDVGQDRHH